MLDRLPKFLHCLEELVCAEENLRVNSKMGKPGEVPAEPAGRSTQERRRGGEVEEAGHFSPRAFHDSITSRLILKTWPIRMEGISPR